MTPTPPTQGPSPEALAIEPAPWCKDALFLITLWGDGAGAILVRGWDELCEELIAAHYHDPDPDQREEVLAYLTDWESWDHADDLPYLLNLTYEDGSICVTRVTEDKARPAVAQEIQRLMDRVVELEAALEPFAEEANKWDDINGPYADTYALRNSHRLTVAHVRKARAVLENKP